MAYKLLLFGYLFSIICISSGSKFSERWSALSVHKTKPFYGCETKAYPPNARDAVPKYKISLDLQPKQRWNNLITEKKQPLLELLGYVYNLTESLLGERIFTFVLNHTSELTETLPKIYREEIHGISESSGLSIAEVTVYNIFYELFTFCTSIVMQDTDGTIYHGRNLDFGLFMGWNSTSNEWKITEKLRPLVVELDWKKGDSTVFHSVSFVGYIGVLTGMKPGAFSLTVNERFSLNGGYVGLLEWILFKDHKQKWLSFLTREVMESASSYEEAVQQLEKPRLLAPVYFIVAGTKKGEGCVITRARDRFDTVNLSNTTKNWYLVQTNYDYWKSPPFYDDRRTPAMKCMQEAFPDKPGTLRKMARSVVKNVSSGVRKFWNFVGLSTEKPFVESHNGTLASLYNVLSTRPVLNKLTTYTTLMSASSGYLETILRKCDDPCWPW